MEVTPELFAPPEEGEADTEGSEGEGTDESDTSESGSGDDEETDSEDAAASGEEGDDEAEGTAPAVPGPPGLVVEFSDTGFAKFSETVNEMRDSLIAGQGASNIFPDRLAFSLPEPRHRKSKSRISRRSSWRMAKWCRWGEIRTSPR